MITIEEYFMGRDKTHASEYTPAIREAALRLIERVNNLLVIVKYPGVVSSGWRPPSINAKVPGASPKSNHTTGHAVDIWDPEHVLVAKITYELLVETNLWMEDQMYTPTWVHLQDLPPKSGNRFFLP